MVNPVRSRSSLEDIHRGHVRLYGTVHRLVSRFSPQRMAAEATMCELVGHFIIRIHLYIRGGYPGFISICILYIYRTQLYILNIIAQRTVCFPITLIVTIYIWLSWKGRHVWMGQSFVRGRIRTVVDQK